MPFPSTAKQRMSRPWRERILIGLMRTALAGAALVVAASGARAQDAVQTWNNTLLTIIAATSGQPSDGPPEVAREMAMVATSMYNAAQVATASGDNVDAAVNQAAYSAMMAIFAPPGTAGSPNTGNPDTLGGLFATVNPTLSGKLVAQINATFQSLGTPVGSAAADGLNAASDVFLARTGSLTAPSDADGSYTAIKKSLTPSNYTPGLGAFSGLAPGASTTTGVGVYVPPVAISPTGHVAITPTWGGVTPFVSSTQDISNIQASIGGPYNVTSTAYANDLMTTYCTGGVSSNSIQAGVCAAAAAKGVNVTSAGVLTGVTVTSSLLTESAAGTQVASALTDNALFWNDPGTTEQPPGHWLDITDTTIANAGAALSELQQAQLTTLVSDGLANAGVAAWGVKYDYNLWRPTTAITGINAPSVTCAYTQSGTVWNTTLASYGFSCDSAWKSYIATPPHPDFIAGHPAFSGAAATILTDYLGSFDPSLLQEGFSNTSQSYCNGGGAVPVYGYSGVTPISTPISNPVTGVLDTTIIACNVNGTIYNASNTGVSLSNPGGIFVPGIEETFDTFTDASLAATDSRVNGGIHTPLAIDDALIVGDEVGATLFNETVPEPGSWLLVGSAMIGFGWLRRRHGRPAA